MAFQQGLSGLNAASTQLDVIGNNIANAGTIGFKSSSVQFASVFANALSGGGSAVGLGVANAGVLQQFSQGTITSSNNPLSVAISGNGFFQVSNNGSMTYTRDGQFGLDTTGAIVTSSGAYLQGYMADSNGVLNTGITSNIVINSSNSPPKQTANVGTVLNLNAESPVLSPASFNPLNPDTYSFSNTVQIYDSLGNPHAVQTYYVNKGVVAPATEAEWEVFATVDGTLTPPAAPSPVSVATFAFTSGGVLDPVKTTPVTTPLFDVPISFPLTNGATSPQAITLSYTGTTQYGAASAINSLDQDGYSSGQLTQYGVGSNGIITGSYSNGQTQTLGQIVLSSFVNPIGLNPVGNNQWLATSTSGTPILGTPGTGDMGVLQSNAVENSTTDLTAELVNMITAQQNYQANAQTIKAANQTAQILASLGN